MFDKVRVQAGVDEVQKNCTIYANWSWIIQSPSEAPKCKVFCCGVEQERLLNRFLFRKQEILDWFQKNVVDFSAENRDELFRLYAQKPANMGKCYYNAIVFRNGDAINRQQPLRFGYEAKNMIFLVCIYDEARCEADIVAADGVDNLQLEVVRNKKLFGLFGDDSTELKITGGDERQKVLIVENGGMTTYSMIPRGASPYYMSEALAGIDINRVKVKYLADFISN